MRRRHNAEAQIFEVNDDIDIAEEAQPFLVAVRPAAADTVIDGNISGRAVIVSIRSKNLHRLAYCKMLHPGNSLRTGPELGVQMESIVAPVLEYLAKFHRPFPETGIVLFSTGLQPVSATANIRG